MSFAQNVLGRLFAGEPVYSQEWSAFLAGAPLAGALSVPGATRYVAYSGPLDPVLGQRVSLTGSGRVALAAWANEAYEYSPVAAEAVVNQARPVSTGSGLALAAGALAALVLLGRRR